MGIIGLATSGSGIIGLIFSIIAIVQAGKFRKNSTEVSGQVNTGRILGIVGLAISIIMILIWLYLIISSAVTRNSL